MAYDPVAYWTERGRTFAIEHPESWDAEDPVLTGLLATLLPASVLDVGCGYGRVGAIIRRLYPKAGYTAFDVSPDLTRVTQDRVGGEVFCADLAEYETDERYDLVIAVSTLGHIRPGDIGPVIEKLRSWARHDLVVMDWDETGESTAYQYAHDYRALMPTAIRTPVGRLAIYHERRP